MLCPDGSRSDVEKTSAGLEVSGNERPASFSKATVILPSRTVLPTFARTPPPTSLVIGMPRFDQKLDELTAERKAARCAAEVMANLSVLPVAAMSLPPTASTTVDSLQSQSTAELEHRGSPLVSTASSSTPMDVEPSDAADTSQADKYSSYDRHFKKKFFGSERRPPSNEPVSKVSDMDHVDGGREGDRSSPDVAAKKSRLAEPSRGAASPLCATVQTPTSTVGGSVPSAIPASTATVSQPSFVLPSGDDTPRGSPSLLTPVSSAAATDSDAAVEHSAACTSEPSPYTEPSPVVTQSKTDSGSVQPSAYLSGQTTEEQVARTEASSS